MGTTILVTLQNGEQIAVAVNPDGTAHVTHREASWLVWSPAFKAVAPGESEHAPGRYAVRR